MLYIGVSVAFYENHWYKTGAEKSISTSRKQSNRKAVLYSDLTGKCGSVNQKDPTVWGCKPVSSEIWLDNSQFNRKSRWMSGVKVLPRPAVRALFILLNLQDYYHSVKADTRYKFRIAETVDSKLEILLLMALPLPWCYFIFASTKRSSTNGSGVHCYLVGKSSVLRLAKMKY